MRTQYSLRWLLIGVAIACAAAALVAGALASLAAHRAEQESVFAFIALSDRGVKITSFYALNTDGSPGSSPRFIHCPATSKSEIFELVPFLVKLRPITDQQDVIFLKPNLYGNHNFRNRLEDRLPTFQILSESSKRFKGLFSAGPVD